MSALGQKQTFGPRNAMSALPPKADIRTHLGERRFKSLPLIWPTLYKSFCFLALLLALNALEEIVVGLIHHRAISDSIAEFGGGTLDQLIASSFIGFLILVPFFAFRTLGEVVGERNLRQVFFNHRHTVQNA